MPSIISIMSIMILPVLPDALRVRSFSISAISNCLSFVAETINKEKNGIFKSFDKDMTRFCLPCTEEDPDVEEEVAAGTPEEADDEVGVVVSEGSALEVEAFSLAAAAIADGGRVPLFCLSRKT